MADNSMHRLLTVRHERIHELGDKSKNFPVRHQWLTPVIPAPQETEIRRITERSQPGQIVHETLSQKTLSQKIGLVKWLKVKALSSDPSTEKKKNFQTAT
jgi:hypothetical protein